MQLARWSLAAVVVLLTFALLADLSAFTVGALTADAYYLPLRSVPVGDHRDEIEDVLIKTHGRLLRHQRRLWLMIHGSALGCALMALVAVRSRTTADSPDALPAADRPR